MSTASLFRRLARLEAAAAEQAAEEEMIEIRRSPESVEPLMGALAGLRSPEELAAMREELLRPRLVNRAQHERAEARWQKSMKWLRTELKAAEQAHAAQHRKPE